MSSSGATGAALIELRGALAKSQHDAQLRQMIEAEPEVLAKYQEVFAPDRISTLTEEEFRGFLMFRNNRHWLALQRMGPAICGDMDRLRQALAILVDESRPIRDRLNQLVPAHGPAFVPRLGKAVLTPILLISHPDRYGVWNQVSEGALKKLGVWPSLERGSPLGGRYEQVNGVLLELARSVGVNLWTLDGLLWWLLTSEDADNPDNGQSEEDQPATLTELPAATTTSAARFGLERHLQDFLHDNWEHTQLGKEWKLHEEDGEEVGYEYPCEIGRIDLLAHHRSEPRWLVIELKRNQTSDQTVGQVLRYMGWVKQNLAKAGESVEGLVIARESDQAIRYALSVTSAISLKHYEVEFRLKEA